MIELAVRLVEEREKKKKHDKIYLRGYFHYQIGDYVRAIKEFSRLDSSDSYYMLGLTHLKFGNELEAAVALQMFNSEIMNWLPGHEQDHALERLEKLHNIIEKKCKQKI